jgi:CBS-domain-containing membrane protein
MYIFDYKIRENLFKFILQPLIAMIAVLIPLIFLDVLHETAIVASLGATAFIVFSRPQTKFSQPRRLFGGYIVGIGVGIVFWFLCKILSSWTFFSEKFLFIFLGALAVGFSIFVMVATDTEHAPAAGIALGLVINRWDYLTLIFILSSVTLFFLIKKLFEPKMIDLV